MRCDELSWAELRCDVLCCGGSGICILDPIHELPDLFTPVCSPPPPSPSLALLTHSLSPSLPHTLTHLLTHSHMVLNAPPGGFTSTLRHTWTCVPCRRRGGAQSTVMRRCSRKTSGRAGRRISIQPGPDQPHTVEAVYPRRDSQARRYFPSGSLRLLLQDRSPGAQGTVQYRTCIDRLGSDGIGWD